MPSGYANNIAAVRSALEAAGVEFTNGNQPGVRMKRDAAAIRLSSLSVDDLNSANDE